MGEERVVRGNNEFSKQVEKPKAVKVAISNCELDDRAFSAFWVIPDLEILTIRSDNKKNP